VLLAPGKGFVFLATPKTASTSIEHAFRPHVDVFMKSNPFKHTRYAHFQRFLQPWLNSEGFPRGSYEVVCVVREPIDWLASWWRYRSRGELANPSCRNHPNYAGHLSFEQFVRAYMDGEAQFAQVGRQAKFVRPRGGQAGVDRLFRYDRLNLLVAYLCEKVGEEVKIGTSNVSPRRSVYLSEECERELREFFAPEYRIYEGAIAEWVPGTVGRADG
jgi:hypothetical protein